MKKSIIYFLLLFIPVANNADISDFQTIKNATFTTYNLLNLAENGLSSDVFNFAIKGFMKLGNEGKLANKNIITIVDYSQSSNAKRLYVIDLQNKKLLFHTYVAHGRNTGQEFAKSFSNSEGSLKSSLGFFVTEHPVIGSHTGFGLLINGLEKGFNDNAERRSIIFHAAEYVSECFIKNNGRLGRSLGCPALPPESNKQIIETIKGGTCLFIYNDDKDYLNHSALLK